MLNYQRVRVQFVIIVDLSFNHVSSPTMVSRCFEASLFRRSNVIRQARASWASCASCAICGCGLTERNGSWRK